MSSCEPWMVPDIAPAPAPEGAGAGAAPPDPALLEEAYARGYADGAREGAAGAEVRVADACRALDAAARALDEARAALARDVERSAVILGLAVARQIVQREVAADPTLVTDLARRAVEVTVLDGPIEIRLNPADLSALGPEPTLSGSDGRPIAVRWVADPTIDRGGCVVETPTRVVDAALDPVLRGFYERLRDA